MAIYDIDAINEAQYEASTDSVLDNMLEACDQMMSALGESGGAHQKYAKMLADKDNKLKNREEGAKRAMAFTKPNSLTSVEAANKIDTTRNEREKLANKFGMYVDNHSPYEFRRSGNDNSGSASERYEKYNKTSAKNNNNIYLDRKAAKERFKRNFHDNGRDLLAEKEKYLAKKKAIKETCLNILSVIDEL